MRHARADYEAIQPWPTKRPHVAKIDGVTTEIVVGDSQAQADGSSIPLSITASEDAADPIIPDDEPVFLIRARDAIGPMMVAAYAGIANHIGCDPEFVERIEAWAEEMRKYGAEHGFKIPDMPEGF